MQPFAYAAPTDLDVLLALLAEHGPEARLLAGGQSLLVLMRQRLVAPRVVIDVKRVPGLRVVAAEADALRLGAAVRHADLAAHPVVRSGWPLLARAAGSIGSIHIRARGTVGGSLAHADPAADLLTALIVLDGRVTARSSGGERTIGAAELATGPFETVLRPDEAIVAVEVPARSPIDTVGYARFLLREGEFPTCQAAVRLAWQDGRCVDARVAVGGAAERPIRLPEVEALLPGARRVGGDSALDLGPVAEVARAAVRPFGDVRGSPDWKRRVAGAIVVRAVEEALGPGGLSA